MAHLPDATTARMMSAEGAAKTVDRLTLALQQAKERRAKELNNQKSGMIVRHQTARRDLNKAIENRWQQETKQRQERFRQGLVGL